MTADIGRVVAAVMLRPDWFGRALEIGGDIRTGSQMAAAFGRAAGLPAEYRELPLAVLDGNDDLQTMFAWFTSPSTYSADFNSTRALDPETYTLDEWIAANGWPA